LRVKIRPRIASVGESGEKNKNKKERPYISRISPGAPLRPIATNFGLLVRLVDVINCAKLYRNQLRGLDSMSGQSLTIPLDCDVAVNTGGRPSTCDYTLKIWLIIYSKIIYLKLSSWQLVPSIFVSAEILSQTVRRHTNSQSLKLRNSQLAYSIFLNHGKPTLYLYTKSHHNLNLTEYWQCTNSTMHPKSHLERSYTPHISSKHHTLPR